MKEVIKVVRKLMDAGGQEYPNADTAKLYRRLIKEEMDELVEAEGSESEVEELDACLDSIWVIIGYMVARGWLVRSAWEEVARSNRSKIDPETGKVLRREDGKILKPASFSPPNLEPYLK